MKTIRKHALWQTIESLLETAQVMGFEMASEPFVGCTLRALAGSKPSGRLLEFGTGIGVGTSWILDGMDAHSELVTVEVDSRFLDVARLFLGDDSRVCFRNEDVTSVIKALPPASFDFVFADSMNTKFTLLEETLNLLRPGGLYVIDDTVI